MSRIKLAALTRNSKSLSCRPPCSDVAGGPLPALLAPPRWLQGGGITSDPFLGRPARLVLGAPPFHWSAPQSVGGLDFPGGLERYFQLRGEKHFALNFA